MSIDIAIDEAHVLKVPKVFGKYEYLKTIGSGSFSAVVLCRHVYTRRLFACKVVSRELLVEQQIFDRFEQEVRILQSLHHPYIVHVETLVFSEDYIYLVMEYCPNGELFQRIVQTGGLDETETRRIFKQICEALSFVHSHNIAHRDLKPENILLDKDMNAKLADFGLCHTTSPQKLLLTPCGSPFYAPPEIINNEEYDGKKADIWSLGVVLYTMATGSLPWTETNQTQLFIQIREADILVPPHVNPLVQHLLRMMLSRNPAVRPSCEEILSLPWVQEVEIPPSTTCLASSRMLSAKFRSADEAWRATQSTKFSEKKPFEVNPFVRTGRTLMKGGATVSHSTLKNMDNLVRRVPPSGKKKVCRE